MMAAITMFLLGVVFAVVFGGLLAAWRSIERRGWRVLGYLMLMVGFLIDYLGYSVGYLAVFDRLRSRWPAWSDFGTWTDDVAAIVPFIIAGLMFWSARRRHRSAQFVT